jgi:ribose transport system substrate-binding protein
MMGGRIMKIKKMLAILAAAMMAGAVAGCSASTQGGSDTGKEAGKETEKETEKEKEKEKAGDAAGLQGKSISLMTPYLGSVTTNQMVEYIEQKLTDAGAEVSVINTNNDFSQLASRLEDVVSAGTDGIVLVSADPGQLSNQLQDVFESEIPVFGCDSGFIEGMQVNATSDNYQMGELIVKYLFDDLMGGKGTVIALTHRPHPGVVKRCEAFDDLIKEYPDITLITEQHVPAEQPINDAQDIVENLLLANPDPDSITAIWAAWDEPAIGATQALQEAGRSQVLVTGVDGNEQAISLVKEGTNLKATVKQNFEGMAQIVYEQMDRYFKGEEIEKGEMYAPATLITQENADAQ